MRPSPPWTQRKSVAAVPFAVFKQAPNRFGHTADAAIPTFLKALDDKDLGTRINGTTAPKQIDPEMAATLDRWF
jgi:hypothetical protein